MSKEFVIGYIVAGPLEIYPTSIETALNAFLERVTTTLRSIPSSTLSDVWEHLRADAAESGRDVWDLAVEDLLDRGEDHLATLVRERATTPDMIRVQISAFVQWWNGGREGSDVTERKSPDHPGEVWVYAGEPSYGDDPEGPGYTKIHAMRLLGTLTDLGIR